MPGAAVVGTAVLWQDGAMSDAEGRALFSGGSELPFDAAAALAHLQRADRRLSALIDRVGPFRLRLETMHTPFASLAEAILHQQLNGRAAATIVGRFRDRIGGGAFPAPAAVLAAAEEDL